MSDGDRVQAVLDWLERALAGARSALERAQDAQDRRSVRAWADGQVRYWSPIVQWIEGSAARMRAALEAIGRYQQRQGDADSASPEAGEDSDGGA